MFLSANFIIRIIPVVAVVVLLLLLDTVRIGGAFLVDPVAFLCVVTVEARRNERSIK